VDDGWLRFKGWKRTRKRRLREKASRKGKVIVFLDAKDNTQRTFEGVTVQYEREKGETPSL